ncbi:hypothetical protein M569_00974 [Genlisea aurea]|uniref:Uncharacterized protein n=1 Tax=Genlisea aurea TaxID=192259 RepID=S8EM82_9LAMI|nr:hypothetical protein M569_00974 [Genlisea aurea]
MNYAYGYQDSTADCESGWTFYLNHSSSSHRFRSGKSVSGDEDGDDPSMISDASSGPPNFNGETGGRNERRGRPVGETTSLRKGERIRRRSLPEVEVDQSKLLDDTASSPVFSDTSFRRRTTEIAAEYSQGHSSTGRSLSPANLGPDPP